MFKRENRLAGDVRFKGFHSFSAPQFVLRVKKNRLTINRFGIVVSKKVDKRAVVRNKIKRFLRTKLANLDKKMSFGHDILFIVRKEILNRTKEENQLAIENVLGEAGVIKMND